MGGNWEIGCDGEHKRSTSMSGSTWADPRLARGADASAGHGVRDVPNNAYGLVTGCPNRNEVLGLIFASQYARNCRVADDGGEYMALCQINWCG